VKELDALISPTTKRLKVNELKIVVLNIDFHSVSLNEFSNVFNSVPFFSIVPGVTSTISILIPCFAETSRLDTVVDQAYNNLCSHYEVGEYINCLWDDGIA
jgi:hypothetical protein